MGVPMDLNNGFMKAPRWLFSPPRPLTGSETQVVVALIPAHLNNLTPNISNIAKTANLSRHGCRIALERLEVLGLTVRAGKGWQLSWQAKTGSDNSVASRVATQSHLSGNSVARRAPKSPAQPELPETLRSTPRSTPRKRTTLRRPPSPLDEDLTRLIDYFREHPSRESVYVPNWGRDKKLLKPQLNARGYPALHERIEGFCRRDEFLENNGNFNAKCVLEAPMSIPGFIQVIDRLNECMKWDHEEEPYEKQGRRTETQARPN